MPLALVAALAALLALLAEILNLAADDPLDRLAPPPAALAPPALERPHPHPPAPPARLADQPWKGGGA